jgi:hypothetical protein
VRWGLQPHPQQRDRAVDSTRRSALAGKRTRGARATGRCHAGSMEVPCSCGDSCGHAYYCHTACDECVDDSDCDGGATCNYDILTQSWDCQTCWPIP